MIFLIIESSTLRRAETRPIRLSHRLHNKLGAKASKLNKKWHRTAKSVGYTHPKAVKINKKANKANNKSFKHFNKLADKYNTPDANLQARRWFQAKQDKAKKAREKGSTKAAFKLHKDIRKQRKSLLKSTGSKIPSVLP